MTNDSDSSSDESTEAQESLEVAFAAQDVSDYDGHIKLLGKRSGFFLYGVP